MFSHLHVPVYRDMYIAGAGAEWFWGCFCFFGDRGTKGNEFDRGWNCQKCIIISIGLVSSLSWELLVAGSVSE